MISCKNFAIIFIIVKIHNIGEIIYFQLPFPVLMKKNLFRSFIKKWKNTKTNELHL